MKKLILSAIFLLGLMQLILAQPSITNALPEIGSEYSFNPISSSFTHQAGGANANWDFSNLTSSILLTYTVIDANTLISADKSTFPACNYATQSYYGGNALGRDFYLSNDTGFYKLGDIGSSPNYNIKNPKELRYNYGMALYNTAGIMKYDGYGTLKTPYGTFNDAFRIGYGVGGDTLFIYYGSTPFIHTLFQYVKTSTGNIQNKYVYNWTKQLTGIKENTTNNTLKLFPNPVNTNVISITTSQAATQYQIFNCMSQLVNSGTLTNTNSQIDISALPAGVYYIRTITNKGENEGQLKFIVQ